MTIPLIQIDLPANVVAVFEGLQGMVTFDFIQVSNIPFLSVVSEILSEFSSQFSNDSTSMGP